MLTPGTTFKMPDASCAVMHPIHFITDCGGASILTFHVREDLLVVWMSWTRQSAPAQRPHSTRQPSCRTLLRNGQCPLKRQVRSSSGTALRRRTSACEALCLRMGSRKKRGVESALETRHHASGIQRRKVRTHFEGNSPRSFLFPGDCGDMLYIARPAVPWRFQNAG